MASRIIDGVYEERNENLRRFQEMLSYFTQLQAWADSIRVSPYFSELIEVMDGRIPQLRGLLGSEDDFSEREFIEAFYNFLSEMASFGAAIKKGRADDRFIQKNRLSGFLKNLHLAFLKGFYKERVLSESLEIEEISHPVYQKVYELLAKGGIKLGIMDIVRMFPNEMLAVKDSREVSFQMNESQIKTALQALIREFKSTFFEVFEEKADNFDRRVYAMIEGKEAIPSKLKLFGVRERE